MGLTVNEKAVVINNKLTNLQEALSALGFEIYGLQTIEKAGWKRGNSVVIAFGLGPEKVNVTIEITNMGTHYEKTSASIDRTDDKFITNSNSENNKIRRKDLLKLVTVLAKINIF